MSASGPSDRAGRVQARVDQLLGAVERQHLGHRRVGVDRELHPDHADEHQRALQLTGHRRADRQAERDRLQRDRLRRRRRSATAASGCDTVDHQEAEAAGDRRARAVRGSRAGRAAGRAAGTRRARGAGRPRSRTARRTASHPTPRTPCPRRRRRSPRAPDPHRRQVEARAAGPPAGQGDVAAGQVATVHLGHDQHPTRARASRRPRRPRRVRRAARRPDRPARARRACGSRRPRPCPACRQTLQWSQKST